VPIKEKPQGLDTQVKFLHQKDEATLLHNSRTLCTVSLLLLQLVQTILALLTPISLCCPNFG